MEFSGKLNSISNFELNKYLRNVPNFKGCFAHDELDNKNIDDDSIYICNYDNLGEVGSHWILILNGVNDTSTCIYVDSFGLTPSKRMLNFMKRKNDNTPIMSNHTTQHTDSQACGYYCMYYIFEMINNKRKFLDVVYDFTNDKQENENLLYNYFLNH